MKTNRTLLNSRTAIVGAVAVAAVALGACNSARPFLPPTPAELTKQVTPADARLASSALYAAITSGAMDTRFWRNAANGHEGSITPVRTFIADNGSKCVEYRDLFTIAGQSAVAVNTACIGADNAWYVMGDDGRWRRVTA